MRAKEAENAVGARQEPKVNGVSVDGIDGNGACAIGFFAAHDNRKFPIDKFEADFNHVAVGVIPNEVNLLVLFGGAILDGGDDFKGRGIGRGTSEDVFGVISRPPHVAGKKANFERAISESPGGRVFANPFPGGVEGSGEIGAELLRPSDGKCDRKKRNKVRRAHARECGPEAGG